MEGRSVWPLSVALLEGPYGTAVGVLVGSVTLLVLAYAVVVGRRRFVQRNGGTFDCSLRPAVRGPDPAGSVDGWMLGVARYSGEDLEWYRLFSLSPRPRARVRRGAVAVLGRRAPGPREAYALLPGAVVVRCRAVGPPGYVAGAGEDWELAMSEAALTGFLSWLEASPPGRNVSVA